METRYRILNGGGVYDAGREANQQPWRREEEKGQNNASLRVLAMIEDEA